MLERERNLMMDNLSNSLSSLQQKHTPQLVSKTQSKKKLMMILGKFHLNKDLSVKENKMMVVVVVIMKLIDES